MSANDDTYTYDSRGNITSKTVGDAVTNFTYANTGWKDLLVSVDDTELEYDANGNVILYGDREFTWTYGRSLASVLDGMDEYTYTYDENGIRTSKTVDGVTTYYNTKDGVILSQTDGENTWYFQYDTSGTPLGFVLNGTQYFYITNQMNDVLAITDTNGDIVGNYEYDAWGKVLTADTDLAKQNPLRYRGYYYDNETGYYYLQSRYYDSNICRFINSDIPEISQMAKDVPVGTNLFAYCNNNPVNSKDLDGHIAANVIGAIIGAVIGAIGGYYLTRWLANKLNLSGWKRKAFIAGLTALITASAVAIGYFVGPYVARAWSYIGARLTGLVRNSFRGIGKITTTKMKHINVRKHLWNKVLGRYVTNTNIQSLIFKAIRNGNWTINSKGVVEILWRYKGRIIVVTGKVVNGILRIGDAWVRR